LKEMPLLRFEDLRERALDPRTALKSALEAAGIEFLDGDSPGVRLKR
jgi:hypothetical protein